MRHLCGNEAVRRVEGVERGRGEFDFYTARHRAADAAGEEALEVVIGRVERVVVNRAFDGHGLTTSLRAFMLSGVSRANVGTS